MLLNLGENNFETIDFAHFFIFVMLFYFQKIQKIEKIKVNKNIKKKSKCYSI